MSPERKKILKILGIIIFVFVILFLLWFFFLNKDQGQMIVNQTKKIIPKKLPDIKKDNTNKKQIKNDNFPKKQKTEVSLKAIIFFVAERFGSYSSDTLPYSNLNDIKYLMTDRMKSWVDSLQKKNQIKTEQDYYGVSTKVLSYEINNKDFTDQKKVKVIVQCQREETFGKNNPKTKIKYQKLKLIFYQVNNKWKLDEARWL